MTSGFLANSLPGWGCLGSPVRATVKDIGHTPYITDSADAKLAQALRHTWPHEEALARLPKEHCQRFGLRNSRS